MTKNFDDILKSFEDDLPDHDDWSRASVAINKIIRTDWPSPELRALPYREEVLSISHFNFYDGPLSGICLVPNTDETHPEKITGPDGKIYTPGYYHCPDDHPWPMPRLWQIHAINREQFLAYLAKTMAAHTNGSNVLHVGSGMQRNYNNRGVGSSLETWCNETLLTKSDQEILDFDPRELPLIGWITYTSLVGARNTDLEELITDAICDLAYHYKEMK